MHELSDHPGRKLAERGRRATAEMVLLWGMSQPNSAVMQPSRTEPVELAALQEIAALLEQAAQLAAANGIEGEGFKRAAWNAYLDARPGLREQLEDRQLRAQLRKLRRRGLVASA